MKIKHRFLEVDAEGNMIRKLPSYDLIPTLSPGCEVLFSNGVLYRVTSVVLDIELSDPELHIELLKVEE